MYQLNSNHLHFISLSLLTHTHTHSTHTHIHTHKHTYFTHHCNQRKIMYQSLCSKLLINDESSSESWCCFPSGPLFQKHFSLKTTAWLIPPFLSKLFMQKQQCTMSNYEKHFIMYKSPKHHKLKHVQIIHNKVFFIIAHSALLFLHK